MKFSEIKYLQGTKIEGQQNKPQRKHYHGKVYPSKTEVDNLLMTISHEDNISFMQILFSPKDESLRYFKAKPGVKTLPEITVTVTGNISIAL